MLGQTQTLENKNKRPELSDRRSNVFSAIYPPRAGLFTQPRDLLGATIYSQNCDATKPICYAAHNNLKCDVKSFCKNPCFCRDILAMPFDSKPNFACSANLLDERKEKQCGRANADAFDQSADPIPGEHKNHDCD